MERLSVDYGKKSKLEFAIYPAPQVRVCKGEKLKCALNENGQFYNVYVHKKTTRRSWLKEVVHKIRKNAHKLFWGFDFCKNTKTTIDFKRKLNWLHCFFHKNDICQLYKKTADGVEKEDVGSF